MKEGILVLSKGRSLLDPIRRLSMLDCPFEFCPICKEGILLDQTLDECAREHGCEQAGCPLQKLFKPREAAKDEDASHHR
jgi:hypothetical protein